MPKSRRSFDEVKQKYEQNYPKNKLLQFTKYDELCTIECPIHGIINGYTYKSVHRTSYGCPLCNKEHFSKGAYITEKRFRDAQKRYTQKFPNNKLIKYSGFTLTCEIDCLNHGIVSMRFDTAMRSDYGCPLCARERGIKTLRSKTSSDKQNTEIPPTVVHPLIYDEHDEAPNNSFVLVPYYADLRLSAGAGQITENLETTPIPLSRIDLQKKGISPKNVMCCKVQGDSMEPMLQDGALVGIDTSDKVIHAGKIYAFVQADGLLRIKSLVLLDQQHIKIHSINFAYPDEIVLASSVTVIGRLFWASTLF